MFARIFGRYPIVRSSLGLGAFLLALAGGALTIWAAVGSSASTFVRVLQAITGIGAIIAGRRIYQHSRALLFPRTRMNAAAILCAVEIGRASCRERVEVWVGGGGTRKRVDK